MKQVFMLIILATTIAFSQEIPAKEDQIAAAVLAAPQQFRADATVMGFDKDGKLVTLREGSNGMICLADDPQKPGFSVAAYHQALEPFMARGRQLRAEGKTSAEVFKIREEEAKSGKIKMPENGATLHIYYAKDGEYDPQSGTVPNAKYRAVVYLPWATAESTGLPIEPGVPGAPWIMDPGTHRAHIMIVPPAQVQKKE